MQQNNDKWWREKTRSAIGSVYSGGVFRPAEYATWVLIVKGYIPGAAYHGDFILPPSLRNRKPPDYEWLDQSPHDNPKLIGRVCEVCSKRKPLTCEHWNRDGKRPDGSPRWRRVCKDCFTAQKRNYYQKGRAEIVC